MLPSWYPENFDDINGIFFREQAEALVRHGMTVGVIAVEGVSINSPSARSAARMRQVATSQENGVTVMRALALRPVPMMHRVNAASLVRRWKELFSEYVESYGMPDVLHAHSLRPAGFAARAIAEERRLPFIVTEHRPESSLADSRLRSLRKLLLATQHEADALIAVSPGFASSLDAAYALRRWQTLPNLLPPQFEAVAVAGPSVPFVFGHVSNLEPNKRVGLLIDAFHQAFGADEAVRLRIAGDSVHRRDLEAKAKSLGASNIEFVGNVPRTKIVAEFSSYHAFVLPSDVESFGVVFWEAMACGLPIIATDTDGGRFAVVDSSGYLVPRDERNMLAARLLDMRANYTSFDRQAIRERAIRECGADAFVRNYRQVYSRAAATEH